MKSKKTLLRKQAADIRRQFTKQYFKMRRAKMQDEYGPTATLLQEFNSVCSHYNLPQLVASKSDYQLVRFLKSDYRREKGIGPRLTREFFLDRDCIVKWFFNMTDVHELPHPSGIPSMDRRILPVDKVSSNRQSKSQHRLDAIARKLSDKSSIRRSKSSLWSDEKESVHEA